MLVKTKGIVIRYIKYRETSIIVNIYTETYGMQSYIVNNIRSAKSRSSPALFQPLSLLELEVYHRKTAEINRLADWKTSEHLSSIYTDIKKATIAIFISEVLYKSIKETESQNGLFDFLYHSIHLFDSIEKGYENFHLQFLLKLVKYLGFGIHNVENAEIPGIDNVSISKLFDGSFESATSISNVDRRKMLDGLVRYYQAHIDGFGKIKSLDVLREVFSI